MTNAPNNLPAGNGKKPPTDTEMAELSPEQADTLPPSLIKALIDPFFYALRLTTGEIIHFEHAEFHGSFVTLYTTSDSPEDNNFSEVLPFPCPCGLDVRVDQIVWCADAPQGS